jgi:hypothetical protein
MRDLFAGTTAQAYFSIVLDIGQKIREGTKLVGEIFHGKDPNR